MGKPCSDRCYCGGKVLFLQMQDILLLSESRLSSLNSVAFSTAAPVPRHTVADWKVTQLSSRDLQIFLSVVCVPKHLLSAARSVNMFLIFIWMSREILEHWYFCPSSVPVRKVQVYTEVDFM